MVINTNKAAQQAANNLNDSQDALGKTLSRLSSGNRILNPSDDAAGLAVNSRMAAKIDRLSAARDNVANAASFIQTQDGYMKSIGSAFTRMSELSMLAMDPTKGPDDLELYDAEFQQLKEFVRATTDRTQNGIRLFDGGTWEVAQDSEGNTFSITKPDLNSAEYSVALNSNKWTTSIDLWQTSKDGYITKVDLWKNGAVYQLTDTGNGDPVIPAGSFMANKPTVDNPLIDLPFTGNANNASESDLSINVWGPTLTTDRHGNANSAYLFDGVDDFIEVEPNLTDLEFTNATFAAWIKSDASGHEDSGSNKIGGIIDRGSQWAHLRLIDDKPSFATNTPYQETGSSTAIARNEWHFVVATYDGTDRKIYVDGTLDTTETVGAGKLDWDNSVLIIGKEVSGHFKGTIDDVRVYDKALTPSEISQLYTNGKLDDVADASTEGDLVAVDPTDYPNGNGEDLVATKIAAGSNMDTDPTAVDSGATLSNTSMNLKSQSAAAMAMAQVQTANQQAAKDRARLGATQARFQAVDEQLFESYQNLSQAKSRIIDVDVAKEATAFAQRQILVQSGTRMLGEANNLSKMALRLLKGLNQR